MNFTRTLFCMLAVVATSCTFCSSTEAQSSRVTIARTYRVQVQYWFFDTDYYYWSTKLETQDQAEAQFLYDVLMWAKSNGNLNSVAPNSYWRYFAVDVRMVTVYKLYQPIQPIWNSDLYWYTQSLFD